MANTYYRDQINKVANAIKEIISTLNYHKPERGISSTVPPTYYNQVHVKSARFKPKYALWLIILISLVISGYFLIPALSKTSAKSLDKSIAVLPFENMSSDPEQVYFSDGMMQEILNRLFMIGGLKIESGTSTRRFKGTRLTIREIAMELGVSYILEGNVYKGGDSIKIMVNLIDGRNENILWTGNFRRDLAASNLFEIQSEVSQKVATNMKVVIIPEVKRRIEAKPTLNLEAYTLYLQASRQVPLTDEGRSKMEKAIRLDSGFADAYALLAIYWLYKGGFVGFLEREKVLIKAEPLVEKSLQLDKNSVMAHTSKAILSLFYKWDFESVKNEFNICNRLIPSNAELAGVFIDFLLSSGEYKKALELSRKAFRNNKESPVNWINMSLSFYFNEIPDSALKHLETINRLFPENRLASATNIRLNNYLGNYDKVIYVFEDHYQSNKEVMSTFYLGHFGIAHFKTGNKSKAIECLHELINQTKRSTVGSPSFFTAALYTAMGDKDNAIQYLRKAYSDHEVEMYWLKVEPLFKTLHGDPRFEEILRKIGFPD